MRRTGRTKAMVMAIPDDGAMVLVHNSNMRRYITQMIGDLRGADLLKRCRIRTADNIKELMGIRGNVAVDHAVWSCMPPRACNKLDDFLRASSPCINIIG